MDEHYMKEGSGLRKVRIGIVGSKFAANLHATAYSRCPQADVVAVAAPDNLHEFADEFGIPERYNSYEEMFGSASLDLVSVCSPNFLHHPIVKAAAEAGLNVVCEKPLATTVEDGADMVRTCRDKGVKLFYAEDWLFAPAILRAKQVIDEGAIGDILFIKAKETHSGSHSPFAQKVRTCGGGAMIHLGVHPAAFARWLAASEPAEVIGSTTPGLDGNLLHKNLEGEDWAVSIMTFRNGIRAVVEGNYITQGGMDDRIEVYGTKGVVRIDLTQGSPISVYSSVGYGYVLEKADSSLGWTSPAVDEYASLGYVGELSTFVKCVAEDLEPPKGVSGEDGLAALAMVIATYRSAKEGRSIDPHELWKELL